MSNTREFFDNTTQEFLDTNLYSKKSILKFERIFGHTWVSPGGETTTKVIILLLYFIAF